MYCPDCGSVIEDLNQNFCPNCGRNISHLQELEGPSTEIPPVAPVESPEPLLNPPEYGSYQESEIQPVSDIGKHSKISLGLAIPAGILAIVAGYMGFFAFMIGGIMNGYYPALYYARFGIWIAVIVIHVVGLILGAVSLANNNKAKELESENGVQIAGKVIGTLALVANIILLTLAVFSFIFLL